MKTLVAVVIAWLSFCASVNAERFTPTEPDSLVASWPLALSPELQQAQVAKRLKPNDPATVAALANHYLALAAMPGQSRLYGLAQAALKPLIEKDTDSSQVWLAWAQVLQHQHAFNEALTVIAKIPVRDTHSANANLLAARIYLIQDKPAQARQACLQLLGHSDLLTTSTCLLEITSHQDKQLAESYQQLTALVKREGFPDDERGPWLAQVLADMALRMGNAKAAADWLSPQLANASVNYLAQWADSQFAQGHYQEVISFLTPIVKAAAETDDLLLLQLAMAEKQLAGNNKNSANLRSEIPWQTQLAERVYLREQRQDSQHANELARYYLDINPQPQKALFWAQRHIANSREQSDQQLLARAQAANNQKIETKQEAATSKPDAIAREVQ